MHILSILQQLSNLLSYFNKFDSRVKVFSTPMMFCNGATGDATCQNGEARHRGEKKYVIMWYVDGFNFSTKHEIYTICIIQRIWTYRGHLLHITRILRRHLEFFIILNEQLQKKVQKRIPSQVMMLQKST